MGFPQSQFRVTLKPIEFKLTPKFESLFTAVKLVLFALLLSVLSLYEFKLLNNNGNWYIKGSQHSPKKYATKNLYYFVKSWKRCALDINFLSRHLTLRHHDDVPTFAWSIYAFAFHDAFYKKPVYREAPAAK